MAGGDYYEARQHLNLSYAAFDVIELDKAGFLEKPSRTQIMNRILSLYREDADASISTACDAYQERLEEQLSALPDSSEKRALLTALRNAHREALIQAANSYPDEHAFKFQLNQENYAFFHSWEDTENAYDNIPGRYMKAIIEEYARKPLVERERIIYREWIDQIEYAIAEHRVMSLRLKSRASFEFRPYCICTDQGYNYNYLVGLSKRAGSHSPEIVSSFRLSNISRITINSRHSRITTEQRKTIEEKLRAVGVQFLVLEPNTICVRLTGQGKNMYDTQAHLRPSFISQRENPDGTWDYEFLCAPLQAQFYFFKFGAEAEILSPLELRESFKNQYALALERYR